MQVVSIKLAVLPPVKILIKRPSLTGEKPATTSATQELATKLATSFPPNPPNYDPLLFGGLTYEEIAAKLAALQALEIPKKQTKKKAISTPIKIDPSLKKKKPQTLPLSLSEEEEQEKGNEKEEEEQQVEDIGSEEGVDDRLEVEFSPS